VCTKTEETGLATAVNKRRGAKKKKKRGKAPIFYFSNLLEKGLIQNKFFIFRD